MKLEEREASASPDACCGNCRQIDGALLVATHLAARCSLQSTTMFPTTPCFSNTMRRALTPKRGNKDFYKGVLQHVLMAQSSH